MSENKKLNLWVIFELYHGVVDQLEEELAKHSTNEEVKTALANIKLVSSVNLKKLRSFCDIPFNQSDLIQQQAVLEEITKKILQRLLPERCHLSADTLKELFGGLPSKET